MKTVNQQAISIILAGLIFEIGQIFPFPLVAYAQEELTQPSLLETPLQHIPAGNPYDLTPDFEPVQTAPDSRVIPTESLPSADKPIDTLENEIPLQDSPMLVPIPVTTKIKINVATKTLSILKNDIVFKTYPVGVGRPGFLTPVGKFSIIRKTKNPVWENPYKPEKAMVIKAGAGNPLGTRWMGFLRDASGEYGIHGTNRPNSVGKASSHGCVRMLIPHAEQVFEQVSLGTDVIVVNEPAPNAQTTPSIKKIVAPSKIPTSKIAPKTITAAKKTSKVISKSKPH